VDRVLPEVPIRQWVLSLPHAVRFLLAYDRKLCGDVLRVFIRALSTWQRRRVRSVRGVTDAHCGAVTFVQRFGGALNLNVHFHVLALDGAYEERPGRRPLFHALAPPSPAELRQLTETVGRRVVRLLVRRGRLPEERGVLPEPDDPDSLLAHCQAASVRGRLATGERAGRRVPRLGHPSDATGRTRWSASSRAAEWEGFSLHAGVRVGARQRRRLERLCRYVARPPLATERLTEWSDGLAYEFRHAWRDGTSAILLKPLELIERLVALIPPPRSHALRYHGVLAPAARLRARVVRDRRAGAKPSPASEAATGSACESHGERSERMRLDAELRERRLTWAELMRRVFARDVLCCPRCGGRCTVLSTITQPEVIPAFLRSLGLPTEPPPVAAARPPPQWELELGGT
jgi:hypothetical protein